MSGAIRKQTVIGIPISLGSFQYHIDHIIGRAERGEGGYVCCVNAHMTVEADRDPGFMQVVKGAELATADGMPVLRTLQWVHGVKQERVAGNDLMPALLQEAEKRNVPVFLYGGKEEVLKRIKQRAQRELPKLNIVGSASPPYRALSEEEFNADLERIRELGAQLIMVSLGCPKQERWMARMRPHCNAVMVGLGGAFLLYAGVDTRAPEWMRDMSLEWMYRLALEPRRLWKRYLVTNSLFLGLMIKERWKRNRS
ncbi:MAG: WecB/TagA/CpsF family glycosyltransferase [Flavobacteriales bacterium]|nr:WecB/TagA/CpsF family glycosyltransferase [Flavobacteriales bacterium]